MTDPLDTFKGGLAAILGKPWPSIAQTNQKTPPLLLSFPTPAIGTLPMAINLPNAAIPSPAHPNCRLVEMGGIVKELASQIHSFRTGPEAEPYTKY